MMWTWKTCDTNRLVPVNEGEYCCYLLVPKDFGGGYIEVDDYDGYGDIGGLNAYEMLGRWNDPDGCKEYEQAGRNVWLLGVEIGGDGADLSKLKYPLKFVEDCSLVYEEVNGCSCEVLMPDTDLGEYDY